MINNYSGIQVFKLDPEGIENGALTIFGEFGSEDVYKRQRLR